MLRKIINFLMYDVPFFITLKRVQIVSYLETYFYLGFKVTPLTLLLSLSNMGALAFCIRVSYLFFANDDVGNIGPPTFHIEEPPVVYQEQPVQEAVSSGRQKSSLESPTSDQKSYIFGLGLATGVILCMLYHIVKN